MTYHILVLTSSYLTHYLEDVLKEHKSNTRFRIVEYDSFTQLKELYLANAKWADGVLTTGAVVKRVLELAVDPPLKPVVALGTDNESFYRIPLSLLVEDRSLDPERIIFDVFVRMMPSASVLSLLESKSMQEIFGEFYRWLADASLYDLYDIEDRTLQQIKVLWETGQIDLVICRYGSLVNQLKKLAIPCVFATCTDEYLLETLERLITDIKIKKITSHSPAAISIIPRNSSIFHDQVEKKVEQALQQFAQENDLNFIIQKKRGLILILTEKSIISFLTDKFRTCLLSSYLEKYTGQSVTVCYGIGNTIDEAIKNSKTAIKNSGFSRHSYLVDEDQHLIGPLGIWQPVEKAKATTPKIQELADQAGLSVNTIQRLARFLQILDQKEITGMDLAENFHITPRGANRILGKLEAAGLATSSVDSSAHLKGRPAKIYHINWEL